MMLTRLLANLARLGLSVEPSDTPGTLVLLGPSAAKTPAVMAALKAFKPDLLNLVASKRPNPVTNPDAFERWAIDQGDPA